MTSMSSLFLSILNMSLTGAFVIAGICLVRLPLRKAPKVISYCLWAVAGFRLLVPFSIEARFSLMPFNARSIPPDIASQPVPRIDSGIDALNDVVNRILPTAPNTPAGSAAAAGPIIAPEITGTAGTAALGTSLLQTWTTIAAYVWIIGLVVMALYGLITYLNLKRNLRSASPSNTTTTQVKYPVYESDYLQSPLILGFLKPAIYLPPRLSNRELRYVLAHEQTHLQRRDHLVKLLAYLTLCLHWFNLFAWVAFLLMGADMEMSCDEQVLKQLGDTMGSTVSDSVKKQYSQTLLSLSANRRITRLSISPLAFSEGGLKERIKSILNFRKPTRIVIAVAVVAALTLGIGFALNRVSNPTEPPNITVRYGQATIAWQVNRTDWGCSTSSPQNDFAGLLSESEIGDLIQINNGETITIAFDGKVPDSVTLTEFILNESGEVLFNVVGMDYDISFGGLSREGSFAVQPNYATVFEFGYYPGSFFPGRTIKGYALTCHWDGSMCIYSFVVRGDAAVVVTDETDFAFRSPQIGLVYADDPRDYLLSNVVPLEEAKAVVEAHFPDVCSVTYLGNVFHDIQNPFSRTHFSAFEVCRMISEQNTFGVSGSLEIWLIYISADDGSIIYTYREEPLDPGLTVEEASDLISRAHPTAIEITYLGFEAQENLRVPFARDAYHSFHVFFSEEPFELQPGAPPSAPTGNDGSSSIILVSTAKTIYCELKISVVSYNNLIFDSLPQIVYPRLVSQEEAAVIVRELYSEEYRVEYFGFGNANPAYFASKNENCYIFQVNTYTEGFGSTYISEEDDFFFVAVSATDGSVYIFDYGNTIK